MSGEALPDLADPGRAGGGAQEIRMAARKGAPRERTVRVVLPLADPGIRRHRIRFSAYRENRTVKAAGQGGVKLPEQAQVAYRHLGGDLAPVIRRRVGQCARIDASQER